MNLLNFLFSAAQHFFLKLGMFLIQHKMVRSDLQFFEQSRIYNRQIYTYEDTYNKNDKH